jgi:hypothetical protein
MERGTCKLCLKEADLCNSHYLGKAFYSLATDVDGPPVIVTPTVAIQGVRQVKTPLLCYDCEQRFRRDGEDYAMTMVNRNSHFKALELVRAAKRFRPAGELNEYFGDDIGIDTATLAYFALSVVWRGCVRAWDTAGRWKTGGMSLGIYAEPVRRYLLDELPLPADMVIRTIVTTDVPSQTYCAFPWAHHPSHGVAFGFVARGLWFDIWGAPNLPFHIRRS